MISFTFFSLRAIFRYILVLFVCTQILNAQETSEILANRKGPFKENIRIAVKDSLGNEGFLPVSIFQGTKEGPVFTVMAGVHGFEYPPIVATQELMKEIDVNQLAGTIIFIPIANRGSFYGRTPYMNPKDKVNLNNAFPGKVNGTITQQLAFTITKKIIPPSDVFLDIHGGDAPEDLIPFVCYYNNKDKLEQTVMAKRLSEAAGFPYVVSYPYTISDDEPAKYAFKQAVQDGKTGLSIESGKLGNVQEEAVALIKEGVYNMLSEMKMYQTTISKNQKFVELNSQTYIRSNEDGIFYSSLNAGDVVNKGDIIAYTTNEFGVLLSEYKAPVSGTILYKLTTPPINKGDTIMCISSFVEEKK